VGTESFWVFVNLNSSVQRTYFSRLLAALKVILTCMLLLLHIVIALGSVGYSSYLFFKPSSVGLKVSYSLVAATLITGTYIAWSTDARILQTCLSGLSYTAIVTAITYGARRRLAVED
jgi:hypothetical protein